MSEPEKIGTIVKSMMKTMLDERCVQCKVRYKSADQVCCGYCLGIIKRQQQMTPKMIEKITLGLVEARYANATMDDIDLKICNQLRERESYQDVFIWGLPGRGKTYLMAALIRAYVGSGYECIRGSFDELCCLIRSTMSPASKQTEWEMTERLKSRDLLFIDDLGLRPELESNFAYQTFLLVLNKRQERMLPTFISSNKSLDRLRETLFDARIMSRLSMALVIEMTGEDRRRAFTVRPD